MTRRNDKLERLLYRVYRGRSNTYIWVYSRKPSFVDMTSTREELIKMLVVELGMKIIVKKKTNSGERYC